MKVTTLDIMFYTPLITLLWTFVVLAIVKIIKELMNKQFRNKKKLLEKIDDLEMEVLDKQYEINCLKYEIKSMR